MTGPSIDPDKRDVDLGFPSIPDVASFIQKHFSGIDLKPSIVERCLCTVGALCYFCMDSCSPNCGLCAVHLMQKTPDGHPFLDRHPVISNVVIGAGFSGQQCTIKPFG